MKHVATPFTKLCLFVLLVGVFTPSKADHIGGSDLTYKCTSTPGVFEITLYILRGCTGVPLCSTFKCTQTVDIMGVDSPFKKQKFSTITLTLVNLRDANPNPDCPNAKSICTNLGTVTPGSYTPAYEIWEFKGFVNLGPTSGIPSACCNVRMSYDLCCRAAEINTGSTWENFHTEAVINRCLSVSPCNSSPTVQNDPFEAFCVGVPYRFANNIIDPDLDSLSYEFVPGLSGVGSSIKYTPPFAYNKPMPWTGSPTDEFPSGIRCDPGTGDVSFTIPAITTPHFYGVVSIGIKQWKTVNGTPTVIGFTRREILLVGLANCIPNDPPRLVTQSSQTLQTQWEVCSGEPLSFTVTALDTNVLPPILSDTTYLSWDRSLVVNGATFKPVYNPATRKVDGPREDSYQFCWTPPMNYLSSGRYYFTVQAKDSRCPMPGKTTRAISINVKQGYLLQDTVTLETSDSGCGNFYVKALHRQFPSNTFQRFVDVALYPDDPTFAKGSVSYPYSQAVNHIFGDSGAYTIRYRAYDTAHATTGCSPFLSVQAVVHNPYTNPTKASITTDATTCAYTDDGRIHVNATSGIAPFLYAIDSGVFTTDTLFSNKPAGRYNVRIKDNIGCVKVVRAIEVKATPRVFTNGQLNANKGTFYTGDTVTYWVGLNDFATSSVSWTVTNGTALSAPGTDHLTVKWNHGPASIRVLGTNKGCTDTIYQSFAVPNVGIATPTAPIDLTVFPNPTQHTLTIAVQNLPSHRMIYLYNLQGKIVVQQELKRNQELDVEGLPSGIYILQVADQHVKVVKQ